MVTLSHTAGNPLAEIFLRNLSGMHVTIMGKRWELRFVRSIGGKKHHGECDPPFLKGKEIRIDKSLTGEKLLETVIHECLHAGDWYISEEWVAFFSRDLARILTRLGYERDDAQ